MNRKNGKATTAIMVLCALVFLAELLIPLQNETEKAILVGAFYKPMIIAGEWWRLLTAGFVHAGFFHLFVNCLSLSMLGAALEMVLGWKKYLTILLLSVIGGCGFLFAAQDNVIAMGLSGGLYGLLACYTWLLVRSGAMKDPKVRGRILTMYFINILINLMPGVSIAGHLGGFVTGLLLSGILIADKGSRRSYHYAAAFAVFIAVVGIRSVQNTYIPQDQRYPGSDLTILALEKSIGLERHAYAVAQRLDDMYHLDGVLVAALKEK